MRESTKKYRFNNHGETPGFTVEGIEEDDDGKTTGRKSYCTRLGEGTAMEKTSGGHKQYKSPRKTCINIHFHVRSAITGGSVERTAEAAANHPKKTERGEGRVDHSRNNNTTTKKSPRNQ